MLFLRLPIKYFFIFYQECHGFVHKNGDKENFILTTCQSYVKRPKTAVIASSERLLTSNRLLIIISSQKLIFNYKQ